MGAPEARLALSVGLVSIVFLFLAALLAWCTLIAVAPRLAPLKNGYLVWAFSFVTNEVPSLAILVLFIAAALTAVLGGLNTPLGWLAASLAAATFAGLVVVIWRQTRSGQAVARGLHEGLGPQWQDKVTVAARLHQPASVGVALFTPIRVRRRSVEHLTDISYGDAGAANTLDIYRHRSRPVDCPVFVHLHGGALSRGRKDRQCLPLIYALADRGWLCVSANYRLQPVTSFPGHLIDVKKVLAWVRTDAAEYGADPATIFVGGSSSGAQLASLAALTANDPAYQPGFESVDTSVTGAVALYGYYGPTTLRRGESGAMRFLPITRVAEQAPPFFIAHGDMDTLTSVHEARHFAAELRAASTEPVVYAELPGAQHGFDTFRSLRADNIVRGVEAFAAYVLATRAASYKKH